MTADLTPCSKCGDASGITMTANFGDGESDPVCLDCLRKFADELGKLTADGGES